MDKITLTSQIDLISPNYKKLPFYKNLFEKRYTKEQTMKSHLQDLARSLGCQGLREIQISKLKDACENGLIEKEDAEKLLDVILDELPAENKKSHLDIRLQMFSESGYSIEQLKKVKPLPEAVAATKIFRDIFEKRNIFEITAAVGAIEKWYVPLAAELESIYLEIGYSSYQVATYSIHKVADQIHSDVCFGFISKYVDESELVNIIDAVADGFKSVLIYDEARFKAAEGELLFGDYLA
ncbi:MAG: hypothetical protein KJ556_10385 [Gammaproteobacteria bacterium]|nr:hypothetical protein [Gammaproteobacteria bacterium]MBU2058497.1 hypothetical protein [Gammaproteobacteria bacterium]MBU2175522.1 hypothetical protein [Gammaproteobacteria bacterium]MBU2248608.1 hypothetical protein [Gammaproteobacteria bacterium]MBU2342638.1 hypothetical protein [Gammaproteobacteria bacterium]